MKSTKLSLVEISRKKGLESPLTGHWWPVVGRVALLSELDDGLQLDGLTFMAKAHIVSVKSTFLRHQFYSAVLQNTVNQSIDRLRASVTTMADWHQISTWVHGRRTLAAVHCEFEDPDICYVGLIVSSSTKSLSLQPISSTGKWISPNQLIKFSAITKIDIGNRYLQSYRNYINSSKMYEKRIR